MAQQQFAQPSFAPRDTYSKVELSISCTNLKDLDYFSKSDPCIFIFEKHGTAWTKLGRSEVVDNNLNPKVCLIKLSGGPIFKHSLLVIARLLSSLAT